MAAQDKLAGAFQKKAKNILIAVIKDFCDEADEKLYRESLAEIIFSDELYPDGDLEFSQTEKVQARFEATPQDFSIVTVEQGDADELKQIFEDNGFDFLCVPNNDEGPAQFIIDKEDLEKFKELYNDLIMDYTRDEELFDGPKSGDGEPGDGGPWDDDDHDHNGGGGNPDGEGITVDELFEGIAPDEEEENPFEKIAASEKENPDYDEKEPVEDSEEPEERGEEEPEEHGEEEPEEHPEDQPEEQTEEQEDNTEAELFDDIDPDKEEERFEESVPDAEENPVNEENELVEDSEEQEEPDEEEPEEYTEEQTEDQPEEQTEEQEDSAGAELNDEIDPIEEEERFEESVPDVEESVPTNEEEAVDEENKSVEEHEEQPVEEPKEQPEEQSVEELKDQPEEQQEEQPKEEPKEEPIEQPEEEPKEESVEQPKEQENTVEEELHNESYPTDENVPTQETDNNVIENVNADDGTAKSDDNVKHNNEEIHEENSEQNHIENESIDVDAGKVTDIPESSNVNTDNNTANTQNPFENNDITNDSVENKVFENGNPSGIPNEPTRDYSEPVTTPPTSPTPATPTTPAAPTTPPVPTEPPTPPTPTTPAAPTTPPVPTEPPTPPTPPVPTTPITPTTPPTPAAPPTPTAPSTPPVPTTPTAPSTPPASPTPPAPAASETPAAPAERGFALSESEPGLRHNGSNKDAFVSTIAREATTGMDNSSYVANLKADFTIMRNFEGIIAGKAADSVLSERTSVERLKGTLSDDGRKAFEALWKSDGEARKRLIVDKKLSFKEAEATYFQELMEKGSFIKKRGMGTSVFMSRVHEDSMPGISTNYFGRQRPLSSIRVNGQNIRFANSRNPLQDTRKARQLQNSFIAGKAKSVLGVKALKDEKIKKQMRALTDDFRKREVISAISLRVNAKAIKASYSGKIKVIGKILSSANAKNDDPTTRQVSKALQYYSKIKRLKKTIDRVNKTLLKRNVERLKRRERRIRTLERRWKQREIDILNGGGNKEKLEFIEKKTIRIKKKYVKNKRKLKRVQNKIATLRRRQVIRFRRIKVIKQKVIKKKRLLRNRFNNSKFAKNNPLGQFVKKRYQQSRYAKLMRERMLKTMSRRLLNTKLGVALSKTFFFYAKIRMLLAKLMFKLILLIGKIFLAILALASSLAVTYGGIVIIIVMVTQFFYWEGEEAFNQEVEASVMGIVYYDLVDRETEWAKGLKSDFDSDEYPYFDELSYTVFEGDKTKTLSAQEYVESVLGREYVESAEKDVDIPFDGHDSTWDAVKGPEPFENAPDEAYKRIIRIDGGKELMFIGAGGRPAHTSNAKEIVCMSGLVQYESDITYEDAPEKDVFDGDDFWSNLGNALSKFCNFISAAKKMVLHAASNFIDSIGVKLQKAFNSNFYTEYCAKKESKMYYGYTQPLFAHSHAVHYGLKLVMLPTVHSAHASTIEETETAYSKLASVCTGNESQHGKISDEHEGHGCMSYTGFTFNDPTSETLFYNGNAVPQAYPAALIESDPLYNKDIPIAPGNEPETFTDRYTYGSNKDSWDHTEGERRSYDDMDSKPEKIDYANKLGIGDVVSLESSDGGRTYVAEVISDVEEHEQYGDEVDIWGNQKVISVTYDYTLTEHVFSYKGDNSTHKGYYCGGHLVLEEYGTIYSFTFGEINSIQNTYSDKNCTNENPKSGLPKYIVISAKGFNDKEMVVHKDLMDNAQDLFDIDASLSHYTGLVHKDFPGWSKGTIDNAVAKYLENWKITYDITTHDTIAGLDEDIVHNTGEDAYADTNGNPIVGTKMTQTQIDAVIAALESNPEYANDPGWETRKVVIANAMSFVGNIGYSQAHHGDALVQGGYTDCSGLASGVWHPYFDDLLNTRGFLDLGKKSGTSHPFSADSGKGEYQAKPGDVLIYTGGSSYHAVVYLGVVNGSTMSVDIGSPELGCRYMHKNYYGQCTVIDMASTVGIR